mgnify:CR=1 FL=1
MKLDVYSIDGKKLKQIEAPVQFREKVRQDLIKKAVLAIQSQRRTPYGTSKEAGFRQSHYISKRRRRWKGTYGRGQSRTPRKVMTKRGSQFYYVGAFAPHTVGGRRAHPPKSEKDWLKEINKKERRKAICSALAATLNEGLVKLRGHKIESLHNVVESKLENLSKTKEIKNTLLALGLKNELKRINEKKIRAGKGKSRGRKYKVKTGPLIVISKKCALESAAVNLPGVDICIMKNLNAELLAPGTFPGRLTIFTEDALKVLQEQELFLNKIKKERKPQ